MVKKFFNLEWKAFVRSASFKSGVFFRILMAFVALYFILIFSAIGVGLYFILEDMKMNAFDTVNQYLIYYLAIDLLLRFFLQKPPIMNIRPLLCINIGKNSIVGYTLGKTALSFFNWIHLFFLLLFSIVLITKNYDPLGVSAWFIGIFSLVFFNNFLNILSDNKKYLLYLLGVVLVAIGGLQYLGLYDITPYTAPLLASLYTSPILVLVPVSMLVIITGLTFNFFKSNLFLDAALSVKQRMPVQKI
jgi:hypothetical protein